MAHPRVTDLPLLIFACFMLGVATYSYVHIAELNSLWFFVGGVCCSVVALVATGTLFFAPKAWRLSAGLAGCSVLIAVYTTEFFLPNKQNVQTERAQLAREYGLSFDTRDRAEIIRSRRAGGEDIYPVIAPCTFLGVCNDSLASYPNREAFGGALMPVGAISSKPSVGCNETGSYQVYTSDRYGFNNQDSIWDVSQVDAAVVGDSFAHGDCLARDEGPAQKLAVKGFRIVNLGMPGNGPLISLASLVEYLPSLKPRRIFWLYYEGNDLQDLATEYMSPILRSYLFGEFSQNLSTRQAEVDKKLLGFADYSFRKSGKANAGSTFSSFLKLTAIRSLVGLSAGLSHVGIEEISLLQRVLAKAQEVVGKWDGELVFMYLPDFSRYNGRNYASLHKEKVMEVVEGLGLRSIDIDANFRLCPDPRSFFPFQLHGHYNTLGYERVADLMGGALGARPSVAVCPQPAVEFRR